jgi:hypothetical protein
MSFDFMKKSFEKKPRAYWEKDAQQEQNRFDTRSGHIFLGLGAHVETFHFWLFNCLIIVKIQKIFFIFNFPTKQNIFLTQASSMKNTYNNQTKKLYNFNKEIICMK